MDVRRIAAQLLDDSIHPAENLPVSTNAEPRQLVRDASALGVGRDCGDCGYCVSELAITGLPGLRAEIFHQIAPKILDVRFGRLKKDNIGHH